MSCAVGFFLTGFGAAQRMRRTLEGTAGTKFDTAYSYNLAVAGWVVSFVTFVLAAIDAVKAVKAARAISSPTPGTGATMY